MVREVITLNVGGAGINLGSTIWEQYNLEHDIDEEGIRASQNQQDNKLYCFYEAIEENKFVPRNLMIDLDVEAIDIAKVSKFGKLFHSESILTGQRSSGGCFARSHYTLGKDLIDKVNDRLRKLVDDCDNIQGFIINHSVGGGTGSGLGTLILERLAVDYRKKSKIGFHIYPFDNNYSNNYVETYNALLTTHWLLDHTEISCVFDNRQMYNICRNKLLIDKPSYFNINSLIAKIVSSTTASLRFEGELGDDLEQLKWNLVCFPRLHFLSCSTAPLIVSDENKCKAMDHEKLFIDGYVRQNFNDNAGVGSFSLYQDIMNIIYSIYDINIYDRLDIIEISDDMMNPEYFSVECLDFDVINDKYLKQIIAYRGDIKAKDANATIMWLKNNKKMTFLEWSPCGVKLALEDKLPASLVDDKDLMVKERHGTMLGNNTFMGRFFDKRICKVYDKMYSQQAFAHWFVAEKMEEGEFAEAREDLDFLIKDYLDCLCDQVTDEYDESD